MTSAIRTVELAPELSSVRVGRHLVRDTLLGWGLAELADDAQLAASELIANAVTHARTSVEVSLVLGDEVTVTVRDEAAGLPVSAGEPPPDSTSGRGLRIVEAISDSWGVRTGTDGKSVWFTLALPDDHALDADVLSLDRQRQSHSEVQGPSGPAGAFGSPASGQARAAL